MNEQLLRQLPQVDQLRRALPAWRENYAEQTVTDGIRQVLAALRGAILAGEVDVVPDQESLCREIEQVVIRAALPSMREVINATGVVLHTNLGRACLSEKAAKAAADAARRYSNLEYDLQNGGRGLRYVHVENLLCRLTGAESALVVNNNAAAVLLVLSALAQGGEVVVSRGELVEIGGAFRVPDIMEACGAQLKEVGTTNKTHLADYERAVGENTRALMKVHTSNYRILGFTAKPALDELVELGHKLGLPVIEDLGSGSLVDLEDFGLHDEPTVQASVRAGVDVVSFSGDKLLGGPQAGIILGKKKYLDVLKKHPLNRAMRVDKMTLAALEATLRSYEQGMEQEIPVIAMLGAEKTVLHERAELLRSMLTQRGIAAEVVATETWVGGGSVPTQSMPSYAVALDGDANTWEQKLRLGLRPVIARIHEGRLLLEVRTLWDEDLSLVADVVEEAVK